VVVCHHDGGHARFPSKLRRLFQRLQLHVTIDYVGLKKTHPRYPTQWDVSMRILEDNPLDGGLYEVVVHQGLATRATFAAGRDDAARRALSAWCYEEAHHLTNSVWGDFPRRRSRASTSPYQMRRTREACQARSHYGSSSQWIGFLLITDKYSTREDHSLIKREW
jgi:hypothetical protein